MGTHNNMVYFAAVLSNTQRSTLFTLSLTRPLACMLPQQVAMATAKMYVAECADSGSPIRYNTIKAVLLDRFGACVVARIKSDLQNVLFVSEGIPRSVAHAVASPATLCTCCLLIAFD
jgi:hypothetical protein